MCGALNELTGLVKVISVTTTSLVNYSKVSMLSELSWDTTGRTSDARTMSLKWVSCASLLHILSVLEDKEKRTLREEQIVLCSLQRTICSSRNVECRAWERGFFRSLHPYLKIQPEKKKR